MDNKTILYTSATIVAIAAIYFLFFHNKKEGLDVMVSKGVMKKHASMVAPPPLRKLEPDRMEPGRAVGENLREDSLFLFFMLPHIVDDKVVVRNMQDAYRKAHETTTSRENQYLMRIQNEFTQKFRDTWLKGINLKR